MAVVSSAKSNQFASLKSKGSNTAVPGATPTPISVSQTRLLSLSKTNPAFAGSVAGAAPHNAAQSTPGPYPRVVDQETRITRGYIRRTDENDRTDPTSSYRMNFMYNPETIQRSFVAYLDQNALDPFNTVHGSGNITAPPGILDFSFELLFDRQLEVFRNDKHPGTKVDYDYFDLVVRGVQPGLGGAGPNAVPDNGVMMVNPRNITVVFGPDLTVTGKPYNASISYDKFSHRMTPTRIRIQLQMKVFQVGPRPLSYTYDTAKEQTTFSATVPYDNQVTVTVTNKADASDLLSATVDAFATAFGMDAASYADSQDAGTGGTPQNATGGSATGTGTGGGGAPWNGPIDEKRIMARIIGKESASAGKYTARNPYSTASGAYQFLDSSWKNYGGYARAYLAPPDVQDARALQDIRYFLKKYNNILEAIPAGWYVGNYRGHGNLDYYPPGPGNPQKVQEYVTDWLAGY